MRYTLAATLFAVFALCGVCLADDPPTTATEPPKALEFHGVRGLLRIACEPTSSLNDRSLLNRLIIDQALVTLAIEESTETFEEPAAGDVEVPTVRVQIESRLTSTSKWFALPPPQVDRLIIVEVQPPGLVNYTPNVTFPAPEFSDLPPGITIVPIIVASNSPENTAEAVLNQLIRVLEEKLYQLDDRSVDDQKFAHATDQVDSRGVSLEETRRELTAQAASLKVSADPQIAAAQRATLAAQVDAASIAIDGLEARAQVLGEQIAKLGDAAQESAARDPVVVELEKAVELRRKILEFARRSHPGLGATQAEQLAAEKSVLLAEGELANHQAELAKYRQQAIQAGGGLRIAELNRRLEDTMIELAEKKAQQKSVESLVALQSGGSGMLDRKRMQILSLEEQYKASLQSLGELRRQREKYNRPKVVLLSSKVVANPTPPEPH